MNQYIIDEEQRSKLAYLISCVESHLLDSICSHPHNPQAEEVGTGDLTDMEYAYQKAVEDIEILHDRLQREREKVLDELAKWVREYDTMYYGDDMPIDILRDKFEELRQGKDGEP